MIGKKNRERERKREISLRGKSCHEKQTDRQVGRHTELERQRETQNREKARERQKDRDGETDGGANSRKRENFISNLFFKNGSPCRLYSFIHPSNHRRHGVYSFKDIMSYMRVYHCQGWIAIVFYLNSQYDV